MSPIKAISATKGERELPVGRSVLMKDPWVVINVAEGEESGYLELPTSGVEVVSQEMIYPDIAISTEPITPPRVPFYLGKDEQIVVSHPTEQKCTLIWEPSGDEVVEMIERQVDSEIERRADRERFPLHYRLWDWGDSGTGIFRGLA